MNIKFYMSDLIGPGLIRGDIPAKYINRMGAEFRVDCKMDIMESDFAGTQIMVFERAYQPAQLNRMLRAKQQGIKTIYDIDDDLFTLPPCVDVVAAHYKKPEVREAMIGLHKNADAIFASSKAMAEVSSKRAPGVPIFILPNYTDFELCDDAYWNAKPHEGIVIGWHGSWSHIEDVPLVNDAMVQIMARYPQVRFKIMGSVNASHFALKEYADRIIELPWVNYYLLPQELSGCDIAICPLLNTQFNRCRSTCKIQEYQSVGVAVVASPMDCYKAVIEDGVTGLIADPESTDAWINCLSRLIENESERKAIALAGRKSVLANNDIRRGVLRYVDAYRKVAQMP